MRKKIPVDLNEKRLAQMHAGDDKIIRKELADPRNAFFPMSKLIARTTERIKTRNRLEALKKGALK